MKIKIGDTLAFYMNFVDSNGDPVAYSGISCQVRSKSGELLDTLTITATETLGRYLATSSDTSGYPKGVVLSDIRVVNGDVTITSETFKIIVEESQTRD